jgi:hypothetical protein
MPLFHGRVSEVKVTDGFKYKEAVLYVKGLWEEYREK